MVLFLQYNHPVTSNGFRPTTGGGDATGFNALSLIASTTASRASDRPFLATLMFDLKNLQTVELKATQEPPASYWRDLSAYDARLRREVIAPLADAARREGDVPRVLQVEMLARLQWYFTVDARPRAPTLAVDDAVAEQFHARIGEAMAYVDAESLLELPAHVSAETRHALWSYKKPLAHSCVALDAYDRELGLVRLTYWIHGAPPAERFEVDGREAAPAYAKLRGCKYFRRLRFRQRIVWLPVGGDSERIDVRLAERRVRIEIGTPRFTIHTETSNSALAMARVHEAFAPGKGGLVSGARRDWKASLVRMLARSWPARWRYRDAWVLTDREHDADDNAEHLYRWLRTAHPEVNAWFLLQPGTPDWKRLRRDGFRLMAPGLRRRLLLLNSAHIASSHPDYSLGKFDRARYSDAMRWKFTYLKHGVGHNDQSHYYASQSFDCVIAASPAEYESFVADDTPYALTTREVRRINLPRFDRLLVMASKSKSSPHDVVVMPTWRNELIDERAVPDERRRKEKFAGSAYATAWRGFLADPSLHELLRRHGARLVFVAHSNLVPYLGAFALPREIEVALKDRGSIQDRLVACCALVTDYSSIAFDAALLRRAVFYFQFDREAFYGGSHNWRPGYFDYARDGFGPIAGDQREMMDALRNFFERGATVDPCYLDRMERALPDQSADACERVYRSMLALRAQRP